MFFIFNSIETKLINMTLYAIEGSLQTYIYLNLANQTLTDYIFTLTSQYSHQPLELTATALTTGDRYTKYSITFPTGFGDEHKNGVYNWSLSINNNPISYRLAKLITEPGGSMGTVAYDSGTDTEERVADVYYRPNY